MNRINSTQREESLRQLESVARDVDDLSPEQWMDNAVCATTDPESNFAEKGGSLREARRICMSCDVAKQCLRYALITNTESGLFGGLNSKERKKLVARYGENPSDEVLDVVVSAMREGNTRQYI